MCATILAFEAMAGSDDPGKNVSDGGAEPENPDVSDTSDDEANIRVVPVNERAASRIGAEPSGSAGWYLNVVVSYSSEDTDEAQRADLARFMEMVDEGLLEDTYNVQTTAYDVSLNEEATHLVIACFNLVTSQKAAERTRDVCRIQGLKILRGAPPDTDVTQMLEPYTSEFLKQGFTAIPVDVLVDRLDLSHGDLLGMQFVREREGGGPTFYILNYDRVSFPGFAGFQIPVAAYGGVFGKSGLSFSLLLPAVAWGANVNFAGTLFRHLGLGILVAPSLVEVPAQETDMFTVARLATGFYVDLAGWIWLGGGIRIDLTESGDHRGVVLLTFGRRAYDWLLGP